MTTPTEALKLAIETQDAIRNFVGGHGQENTATFLLLEADRALSAVRSALAQPKPSAPTIEREKFDTLLAQEHALSAAYVRLREIIGAMDPPTTSDPQALWAYVERVAREKMAQASAPSVEPILWQYRWTNPGDNPNTYPAELEWKIVAVRNLHMETIESRIKELSGYTYNGRPTYEVRPLYAAPTPPAASASASDQAQAIAAAFSRGHDAGWQSCAGHMKVQAAPVAPEPDMRHPKIQRLIGAKARREIELGLVEQLLDEGPDCEVSSMCMEYWNSTHDKLRAALIAPAVAAPVAPEPITDDCGYGEVYVTPPAAPEPTVQPLPARLVRFTLRDLKADRKRLDGFISLGNEIERAAEYDEWIAAIEAYCTAHGITAATTKE